MRRVVERAAATSWSRSAATPAPSPSCSAGRSSGCTHADAVAATCTTSATRRTRTPRSTGRARSCCPGKASRPFFVTDYPKGSRGFYDRESRDQPGPLRNFDLIAPEGYGELCSGSEREYEYGQIIARMRETGENPAKYGWYLDMVRDGIPASAGFGLGLERLTRYVAGLDAVWQATAYPKLPGVVVAVTATCTPTAFPEEAVRARARHGHGRGRSRDTRRLRQRRCSAPRAGRRRTTGSTRCGWCRRCSCRSGWRS